MKRAITIRQPFADLFFREDGKRKTLETRPMRTYYRGRLYIHAGKTIDEEGLLKSLDNDEFLFSCVHSNWIKEFNEDNLIRPYLVTLAQQAIHTLQRSAIIGHVDIVDCVEAWRWIEANRSYREELFNREWAFGDLSGDRWAWVTENPVRLAKPILCNGQQGFWDCSKILDAEILMH